MSYIVYGSRSFVGKSFLDYKKDEGILRVSGSFEDLSYDLFKKAIQSGEISSVRYLLYATGAGQVPHSSIQENHRMFEKNMYDFFDLVESVESILSKDASILYISSGHAFRASDVNPYYAASKAAVNSFIVSYSKKLAKMNLKDGGSRRINGIAPEAIDSPLIDKMVDMDKAIDRSIYVATRPNYRLLDIMEVVYPIDFFLSEKSKGFNGTVTILGGVK